MRSLLYAAFGGALGYVVAQLLTPSTILLILAGAVFAFALFRYALLRLYNRLFWGEL